MKLRPYQNQGIKDIRAAYTSGNTAPVYCAPTGAGKTVIFSYIAQQAAAKGTRILILMHRVELVRQTSSALSNFNVDHGIISPKYTSKYWENIQVASVQSLVRRLTKVYDVDLIIIDEAHHAHGKNTWVKVCQRFPGAKVLGVTATPQRGNGAGLGKHVGGIFDSLVMGPQIAELIEAGYLARPITYAPLQGIDLSEIRTVQGDYDNTELAERLDNMNVTGDAINHYTKICPGKPAVAFCVSRKHSEHVADSFRLAGYRAEHVDGTFSDAERSRILGGLSDGSVQVVCSCDIISEGTDIPAIEAAILLRPTKSVVLYIQQAGRALRIDGEKSKAYILDHAGNSLRHGLIDEQREWTLEGTQSQGRGKEKESVKPVRQCEACYAVFPAAKKWCPECGEVVEVQGREVDQEDGELVEVGEAEKALLKKQRAREVGTARTRRELQEVARKRGYKPGWVDYVMKARAGKGRQN